MYLSYRYLHRLGSLQQDGSLAQDRLFGPGTGQSVVQDDMGGCQEYGPLLVYRIGHLVFRGPKGGP